MKNSIVTLIQIELAPNESKPFCYVPTISEQPIKGFLLSNGAELSLAFDNGTDLKLNSFPIEFENPIAPDSNMIVVSEKLKGQLQGMITNFSNQINLVSAYLILE